MQIFFPFRCYPETMLYNCPKTQFWINNPLSRKELFSISFTSLNLYLFVENRCSSTSSRSSANKNQMAEFRSLQSSQKRKRWRQKDEKWFPDGYVLLELSKSQSAHYSKTQVKYEIRENSSIVNMRNSCSCRFADNFPYTVIMFSFIRIQKYDFASC